MSCTAFTGMAGQTVPFTVVCEEEFGKHLKTPEGRHKSSRKGEACALRLDGLKGLKGDNDVLITLRNADVIKLSDSEIDFSLWPGELTIRYFVTPIE